MAIPSTPEPEARALLPQVRSVLLQLAVERRRPALDRRPCEALLDHLTSLGIVVRDLEAGLVDFPTIRDGEPAWLCWRLDDPTWPGGTPPARATPRAGRSSAVAPRVTVIGDALLDVRALPATPLRPGADVPASIDLGPGGQGANVAVRLARRGVPTRLVCRIGPDAAGDLLRRALAADGVEVLDLGAERTGAVVVLVDAAATARCSASASRC